MDEIKEYINIWDKIEGVKPTNDLVFITAFTEFARTSDIEQWDFRGENGYCGYTARVQEYPYYTPLRGLGFEFAYDKNFVKVFTDKHNGFWTPEYISLEGDEAGALLSIIKDKLNTWGGCDG